MGGLGILFLLFAYIWLNIKLINYVWKNLSKPAATVTTILILAFPFVDAMIGRAELKAKCEVGTRIVVKRSIPNIEAIFVDGGITDDSPSYYGYKAVEDKGYNDKWHGQGVRRATESGDPKNAIIEKEAEKIAVYGLWTEGLPKTFWLNAERYTINNRAKTDELGSFIWYSFRGGWAEYVVMTFSDAGPSRVAECGDTEAELNKIKELLHTTLQPAK